MQINSGIGTKTPPSRHSSRAFCNFKVNSFRPLFFLHFALLLYLNEGLEVFSSTPQTLLQNARPEWNKSICRLRQHYSKCIDSRSNYSGVQFCKSYDRRSVAKRRVNSTNMHQTDWAFYLCLVEIFVGTCPLCPMQNEKNSSGCPNAGNAFCTYIFRTSGYLVSRSCR